MLKSLIKPVYAHCDLPCGVYDPVQALVEAKSVYAIQTKYDGLSAEDKIRALLSSSRIEIKNKIIVAVIDKHVFTDDLLELERKIKKSRNVFYAIEGTDAITIITAASFLGDIRSSFK